MKTTNKIFLILGIVLGLLSRGSPAFSQTALPVVVASTGSDAQIGNTHISYTVGESVTTTLSTGTNTLTQGFHQPDWLTVVGITETGIDSNIKVFPNPTPGMVNVIVGHEEYEAAVYDVNGQIVVPARKITGSAQIDLTDLAAAHYFLLLTKNTKRYSIALIKVH